MRRFTAAVAIALFALLPYARPANADTVITTLPPENGYPKSITFRADISSDQQVREATLRFTLRNRGLSGFGRADDLAPGTKVQAAVVIDTNPDTNWLPVGNEFLYHWEVSLADGSTVLSPEETYLYLPSGRDWQKTGNELMTVYYYGERSNTATRYLSAASEVYAKVGTDLLRVTLPHLPVKVVLVVTSAEVAEAQPSKGQTFEASGVVVCGFRPGSADDIVIVSAGCSGGSSVDTLRHEFGHILNAAAAESALVKLPSWMDEGLAVYAQERNDFEGAYTSALRRGTLLPFDRLNIPPSDPSLTLVFYGQSHAMVKYLIDSRGGDTLAGLTKLTKGGTRFDRAFEETYGFDMKGFEAAFRAANGLPPAAEPTAAPQPAQPTPGPTASQGQPAAPTVRPTTTAGSVVERSDDGVDAIALGAVGFAMLAALLAIFLFFFSQLLSNRRQAAAAQPPSPAGPSRFSRPPDDDTDRDV